MITCVFIQINEPMPEGQKSICTFETVYTIGTGFRHLNFGIKEGILQSNFPFFFQYRCAT